MSDFVQLGQSRTQAREYDEFAVEFADVDSFTQLSSLSFNDARAQMDDAFSSNPRNLVLFGPLVNPVTGTVLMKVGNTIQLTAQLFREKYYSPSISPDAIGQDVTAVATWYTNPAATAVTVVNGLVTATGAGSVSVYAMMGDFTTLSLAITVS
jgi:hypothetical protein